MVSLLYNFERRLRGYQPRAAGRNSCHPEEQKRHEDLKQDSSTALGMTERVDPVGGIRHNAS